MAKKKSGSNSGAFSFDDYMEENDIPTLEKMEKQQQTYRTFSTGSFMLDIAIGERDCVTGRPGIPERAIVEVFGINQSCKTATLENLLKSVLDADPDNRAVVIWAEEPDMDRLLRYGINPKRVASLYAYDDSGEVSMNQAERSLERAKIMCQDPAVKLVGLDSIKALCSSRQLFKDGKPIDMDTPEGLAIRANMVARFIMGFKQYNKRAILFMTNQISDKIGTNYAPNPKFNVHTPGGRAKEFECTLRIQTTSQPVMSKKKHSLTEEELLVGWEITYRIIKNKYSKQTAYRTANSTFMFEPPGFRRNGEVISCASYLGLVDEKGGGNFVIAGEKIRGKHNVMKYLDANPQVVLALENQILERMDEVYGIEDDEDDIEELLG